MTHTDIGGLNFVPQHAADGHLNQQIDNFLKGGIDYPIRVGDEADYKARSLVMYVRDWEAEDVSLDPPKGECKPKICFRTEEWKTLFEGSRDHERIRYMRYHRTRLSNRPLGLAPLKIFNIPKAEERAVTLEQLELLQAYASQNLQDNPVYIWDWVDKVEKQLYWDTNLK